MKNCLVKAGKKKDVCGGSRLKSSLKCQFCDGNHDLDDCQFCNELSVEDRSSFLKKNKLCYRCYREITSTHTCNNGRVCKVCQGKHLSGLHGYKMKIKKTSDDDTYKAGEQPEAMKNNCAGIKNVATVVGEIISMCVVPVRLRHRNSQKEVKTFTLLDSCSQDTFVTEQILKELDVTGVKTSINIKTLNGNQKFSSTLVDGIMVSKQVLGARDQIHWVKLPKLYTRKEIPVDPAEVATPLKLKNGINLIVLLARLLQMMQYQLMFLLVQTVQRLWNQLISLQVKMEVLMLWRLFWGGVLWDSMEGVAKGIIPLATIELLFKMQEQIRYPGITLKLKSEGHRNK